jgi:glycosyltransferase involved in cell wall biosynthesis
MPTNNRILYIGGFELPDRNAAAQRVLPIAKALRDSGNKVLFYGITNCNDYVGVAEGFDYEAVDRPSTTINWIKYSLGKGITKIVERINPNIIITYNYPALAQEKIIRYCHKHKIKVYGDITEWYQSKSLVKNADVFLRMKWSNKHLDGIIAISRYLLNYYSKNNTLLLPPLVDKSEEKWKQKGAERSVDNIKLAYVGSPGIGKDRLDFIIKGLSKLNSKRIELNIVGISEEQYLQIYGLKEIPTNIIVKFYGRIEHKSALKILMSSDFQVFFRDNIRVNNAGFPTKYVEATSAGIPVVTNRTSNIAEFLKDGFNGFLIENPTQEEIYNVLLKVSSLNREDIQNMKNNCDINLFDYHRYVDKINSFVD